MEGLVLLDEEEQRRNYSVRVHKVFAQNEVGAELLNEWTKNILQAPLPVDATPFAQGVAEGQRTFIRHLIFMIEAEL